MDAQSIPTLTEERFGQAYINQLIDIVTYHTPERLLAMDHAGEYVRFTRNFSNTINSIGSWKLERLGEDWLLTILVEDTLRQQHLPPSLTFTNHKIHRSLLEWTKICNGIELEAVLKGIPGLAHITAASVADRTPFDDRNNPGIPWN